MIAVAAAAATLVPPAPIRFVSVVAAVAAEVVAQRVAGTYAAAVVRSAVAVVDVAEDLLIDQSVAAAVAVAAVVVSWPVAAGTKTALVAHFCPRSPHCTQNWQRAAGLAVFARLPRQRL